VRGCHVSWLARRGSLPRRDGRSARLLPPLSDRFQGIADAILSPSKKTLALPGLVTQQRHLRVGDALVQGGKRQARRYGFLWVFGGLIEKGNENVFHSLASRMATSATVPQNRNSEYSSVDSNDSVSLSADPFAA
jgi:hypothetical protein